MDLNCPKCQSDQTQKITAIVDGGTTHSKGTTVSTGLANVGGRMAIGSSVGSTSTTSTTVLARKLAAPVARKEGYILQLIGLMILLGWVPSVVIGALFHSEFLGLLLYPLTGFLTFKKLKAVAMQNREYNARVYPQARHEWENGFFCHRCEHVFIPQSR